ncbi:MULTISPECIES: metallophosphoesterase family protein [unclassified Ruegeria]|uniref:metallophosphoesterase family protein n=1 Tax=unclassified Ruegeria TaxID=2625375 RepID=UPI0014892F2E|nr:MULTISPECIES: metallophosphoesterase family protein [unclassified Ruegeria]NOD34409.1 serine/threonine protein phosphatase [Ruegeria sp. HKCCD7296]NOE34240.1 serine/threonine protein phosphatase [Ruegeria sp. HKCCD7318]NOE40367.1 serine/threonine protein phosphatase [Ruegeria sp. HKCCD7319]
MVTKWIKSRFNRSARPATETVSCDISPGTRVTAVGDIHGRLDLLHALLPRLDDQDPLVFVGDYIDRGPNSAHVLRHLLYLSQASGGRVHCLLGNHEEMLLRFVDAPEEYAPIWFRNGGVQTLASFGLKLTPDKEDTQQAKELADGLRQAMGQTLLNWLSDRPLTWTSGNATFVHAALDPRQSLEAQDRQICLWGHPMFPRLPRSDGQWVVHGHTIVDHPRVRNRVLSIDTGAFASGRLTAAEIQDGSIRFLSTG